LAHRASCREEERIGADALVESCAPAAPRLSLSETQADYVAFERMLGEALERLFHPLLGNVLGHRVLRTK
jgi:hypothetical protein